MYLPTKPDSERLIKKTEQKKGDWAI